jgi:hypothetical protein
MHNKYEFKEFKINNKKFQKVLFSLILVSPYSSLNYTHVSWFNESLEDAYCYANQGYYMEITQNYIKKLFIFLYKTCYI